MHVVNFPCTVRLIRLIAPSLLMAISALSLIDCLNAFLDPNFMCIPVKPLNIYLSQSERTSISKSAHLVDHSEFKTAVVFLFEMFAGLVNFLTGGLYLLLTFSCIITQKTVDQTFGRRLRVPFPRKIDEHSPVQLVSFIEFSSFLSAVAGTFGTLMMITTMSLRYRSMGGQPVDANDQIRVWNISQLDVDLLRPPCHIYQTSSLTNTVIMLCVDIILVAITILPKRASVCDLQASEELGNFNRAKTEELSLLSNSNKVKKVACFCLDLTRLILMLASVLITCGGLNILGGALQLLQMDHTRLTHRYQVDVRTRLKEMFCIFDGILALCCGIFAVTSIHCCSTPLEVLFSEVYELNGKSVPMRHRFGRFTHILTISLGLVALPISSGSYVLLRVDFSDYSQMDVTKRSEATSVGVHASEVLRVGYTLSCFASLVAFLVSAMLMVCLLVDIYLRIKLMEYYPSVLSVCTSHNRIDKTLLESVNYVSANTNQYFAHWKDSEPSSLINKPQYDSGTFIEIENHLMPVVNHRHVGDPGNPTLPMRNAQLGTLAGKVLMDQTAVTCPPIWHNNTVQPRTVTPQYLASGSHYATDVAFRHSETGESIYHRPDGQNNLIYICSDNNKKAGGISSIIASTPATTSLDQQITENQDCMCEYMSCEIDCDPEETELADAVAGRVGIGNTDLNVASDSPQPVWYYDTSAFGEGTFTSV